MYSKLIMLLMLVMAAGAAGQNSLVVHKATGGSDTYALSAIAKITLPTASMNIQGPNQSYPLNTIAKLTFTQGATGIAASNASARSAPTAGWTRGHTAVVATPGALVSTRAFSVDGRLLAVTATRAGATGTYRADCGVASSVSRTQVLEVAVDGVVVGRRIAVTR
jgi:hypothetical protein